MNNTPMVSVIMPVYNARKYIESTIESVLNQTFTDFELILIDDGATDGSGEVCDTYASMDKRIVLIHQANGGICKARNAGLAVAKGKYIAFCDHDDLYQPQYLELSVDAAEKKQADLVKFSYRSECSYNGVILSSLEDPIPNGVFLVEDLVLNDYELLNKAIRVLWNGLYKTEVIKNNGLKFNEKIHAGMEDFLFNIQLLQIISKIVFIPQTLFYHYSRLEQSTSEKYSESRLTDIKTTMQAESIWLSQYNVSAEVIVQHRSKYVSLMSRTLCHPDCPFNWRIRAEWLRELKKADALTNKGVLLAAIKELYHKPKMAVQDILFSLNQNLLILYLWKLHSVKKNMRAK